MVARNICILHAEDDRFTSASIARLLTVKGFIVQSAANGLEALEMILGCPSAFDLIITDQSMPSLSGVEWLRGIRDTGFTGRILVFAADLSAEDRGRFVHLGVNRIVNKSAGLQALLDAVEFMLVAPATPRQSRHGLAD
jgi:DNA-binding response OmpR family regulator